MRWLIALIVCGSTTCSVAADTPPAFAPYTKPTLIAHRGASWDAPEHTIAAYTLALEQGADFIEPDLQLTKDGVLVCLHDTTLERTTNVEDVFADRCQVAGGRKTWPVADFTLAEILELDAGSWKGPQFAGTKVPTFQEMIDTVEGQAGIIPETKAPEAYGRRGMSMERVLMDVLKTNGLDSPGDDPETPVVIQSFSAASLKALRNEHGCTLPLVFLFDNDVTTAEQIKAIKQFADGIAPSKSLVQRHPQIVGAAHDLGMSVTVWTFRPEKNGDRDSVRSEMRHFLNELKVDALFTDTPALFPRN
ncbi:MAG: glycerophosphodiester phosphodiesterase family protein [Pirellulales bacterium]